MRKVLTSDEISDIPEPVGPPSKTGLLSELATAVQPARLLLNSPKLRKAPRGDARIAVLLPGWKAPESSTFPMRQYLKRLGHDARSWGRGVNQGDVEAERDGMIEAVDQLCEESGRPVNLVGWSLGGVVAREVARSRPDAVHRLVIYGSPVVGGPNFTVGKETYSPEERDRISELLEHLEATDPITTPTTLIFTRKDRVVDWRACIDRASINVEIIEVGSTHIGLGIDPDVWLAVATALAEEVRC